ncbi:DNA ligase [Planosporangium thailandense]|uniref:DNA ligase (ATP) n=2 Tax=Planosporangium thailandense TaxID=765197 RepID=A0ABX0Y506_9ACTN|nr:DNA ligase [Planosporangium thailandense]
MLATLGDLPTGPEWAYEFKWDGVRAVTRTGRRRVRVLSRNNRDLTATYPELAELGAVLGERGAVVDGEVVALDSGGRPSFERLQRRMHVGAPTPGLLAAVPVVYHVFDVLHVDGESTLRLPYEHRRELLAALGLTGPVVTVPAHFTDVDGAHVLTAARAAGLEGVVAKRLGSTYQPGRRSADWIKVPIVHTQEVVIVGYTAGAGRRAGTIGSLLLAVHDPAGRLRYAGHVGTGFTESMLRDLQRRLVPLHRRTPAVGGVPRDHARHARWVDPVVVGEVAYRTWTPDGRLRLPSWRGLRPDRDAAEVHRPDVPARPAPPPPAGRHAGGPTGHVEGAMQTSDGRWRVEVVRRGTGHWYRIVHGENTIDWLSLADVERILGEVGVDLTLLREVGPAA